MKGTSFNINPNDIERTTKKLVEQYFSIGKKIEGKTNKAVEIVFRTATAKRPMITVAQAKAEGRRKIGGKYKRVSDPNAKLGVPVDTGELKASIKKTVGTARGKTTGRIWTNSDHANAMEFGTSRIAPRPFMRPAIALNMDIIKKLFREKE